MAEVVPTCTEHEAHVHELLPEGVLERAAALCSAVGDPSRLRLLELLVHQRHCVSELAAETEASMSAVSQRLKLLAQARLVKRTREGKHVFYALADDRVRRFLHEVLDYADE